MAQATVLDDGPDGTVTGTPEGRVIEALSLVVRRMKRTHDADAGGRMLLLAHLDRLGPLRMSDLATRACLDQSTVSRHLRHLDEEGLVSRSPDPDDGRATLLDLSSEGRESLARAVAHRTELIATATSAWAPEDREALARLLTRLADDLENL